MFWRSLGNVDILPAPGCLQPTSGHYETISYSVVVRHWNEFSWSDAQTLVPAASSDLPQRGRKDQPFGAWTESLNYECPGQSIGGNHHSHTSLKHSLYCLVIWSLRTCYCLYQKKAGLSPHLDQIFFSPFLNILYNQQCCWTSDNRNLLKWQFPLQSNWTAASCPHRGQDSAPPSDDLTCLSTFLKAASGLF